MNLKDKIHAIMKSMVAQGTTLGFAESCTGGLLSSLFVAEPGASQYFMGSIISYDRRVKNELLNVPMTLMQAIGEVSTPVALAMAKGVQQCLHVNWAVSITGIAGPSGGSAEKPVGTVCFSIVGPGVELTEQKNFGSNLTRLKIQELSAEHAVNLIYNYFIFKS